MRRLIVIASLLAATIFFASVPHTKAQSSHCHELLNQRNYDNISLQRDVLKPLAAATGQLKATSADDRETIDLQFRTATAWEQTLRRQYESATPSEKAARAPALKLAEDYLDFWRAKRTALITGVEMGGEAWVPELKGRIAQLQSNEKIMRARLATLDRQIAACQSQEPTRPRLQNSNTARTKWSGNWYRGSYKVTISGGAGSFSYRFDREDDVGTCCPTIDKGSGTCSVEGNVAKCDLTADYSDSAKKVHYEGKGILSYAGDSINYTFTLTSGTIQLTQGECPDISQCTGLHPGAVLEGTWSRTTS